jgi:uncharacterized membrane protein SpoIIM required for sporulation
VRQAVFEARYAQDWTSFEQWLDQREKVKRTGPRVGARAGSRNAAAATLPDAEIPRAYRRLCQHLALARDRAYSPELVDRLNYLALRGHHLLYGARSHRRSRITRFFLEDFPGRVRTEWPFVTIAALLFFGPLLAIGAALQAYPDFVHYLLSPRTIGSIQEMYDPTNPKLGMRAADTDVMMFAFYIYNNVRIGFQCFAMGLLFGLGTVFYLVSNGIQIGAIAGYLTQTGFGTPFWSFVSGHSAMELTAIAISGAAGLKLGAALIAPGNMTRRAALVAAARGAIRLVYGAATMFLVAAFIEAFWSPLTIFPPATKYAVGAIMWAFVLAYFLFVGRGRGA